MVATPAWVERLGFRAYYRLVDLTYALGVATPKRTVAGTYRSYEPTNSHGDDPGLAALDTLPPDATVLDVGAHVGEHAIPLAVGTNRRVVAFEPNGESADRLERNVRRNGLLDRIDCRRAGVGDERATLTFYRSTFSKCSAFDRESATRWGARVADTESVPVWRIDDLVDGGGPHSDGGGGHHPDGGSGPHPDGGGPSTDSIDVPDADRVPPPDGIKIDVEGREFAVLRGAERTVRQYRPLLVVEAHATVSDGADWSTGSDADDGDAPTLRSWLTERGYDVDERGDVWVCRG